MLATTTYERVDYPALLKSLVGDRVPESEQWRTIFGRNTNLSIIANALQQAQDGYMRDLDDLASETLGVDPHLCSITGKRFGAIAASDWEVSPAQGDDLDPELARICADGVRSQLNAIPSFNQAIKDLTWGHWNGRAAQEMHWSRHLDDRRFPFHVTGLGWIAPRRLSFGPERELRLIDGNQYPYNFYPVGYDLRTIPWKFLTFTPRLFNEYPEREGLAPRCLYWSFFKRFSARERMILLELFGKPWKIVNVAADSTAGDAALEEAFNQAEALGGNTTARFPKGLTLTVERPHPDSGKLHNETIVDCDNQNSKIVLGGTGTTDAKGGGINDNTASVHADEKQYIKEEDGKRVSEVIRHGLVAAIIAVNAPWLGIASHEVARYTPGFRIRTEKPLDRAAELKRIREIVDMGVPVAVDEIREKGGVRKPKRDEAVVQLIDSPQLGGDSARFIPPRVRVIDPTGTEPGQDLGSATEPEELYSPTVEPSSSAQSPAPESDAIDDTIAPAPSTTTRPNLDDDDDWEIFNGPIGRIQKALADDGIELLTADEEAGVTNFPTRGDNLRPSLRNSRYKVFPASEAEELKRDWPEIWKAGGNVLGNLQFRRLVPIAKRGGVVETDTEEEAVRLREAWAARHVDDHELAGVVAQVKWLVVGLQGIDRMRRVIAEKKARLRERGARAAMASLGLSEEAQGMALRALARPGPRLPDLGHVPGLGTDGARELLEKHWRPGLTITVSATDTTDTEPFGSVETLVERGTKRCAPITTRWASSLSASVDGLDNARDIRKALRAATDSLSLDALTKVVHQDMVHSALLGVLDAAWEAEHGDALAPATFDAGTEQLPRKGQPGFAAKPFQAAIDFFKSKKVVSKSIFDTLFGAAKRAAFTIAGLARKEMLETAFDELGGAITRGEDLRNFRRALDDRFDSAGWTRIKPSHVETVFRNATAGAYASGRKAQMTQPAVLKARPYWQIVCVRDDRTRDTHWAANGKVLRADDPFWKKSPPPFGHCCRCRPVSRSEKDLKRLGLTVVKGSTLKGLPDPGWNSSISMIY